MSWLRLQLECRQPAALAVLVTAVQRSAVAAHPVRLPGAQGLRLARSARSTAPLQAFKHANLSAVEVLYWLSGMCTVVVLPISLGVDGTDWGAQFRGGWARPCSACLLFACLLLRRAACSSQRRPAYTPLITSITFSRRLAAVSAQRVYQGVLARARLQSGAGMTGSDWAALLFCACVAHIGSVLGIQVGRWAGRRRVLA